MKRRSTVDLVLVERSKFDSHLCRFFSTAYAPKVSEFLIITFYMFD